MGSRATRPRLLPQDSIIAEHPHDGGRLGQQRQLFTARAWNSGLYSTIGGQSAIRSEPPVPQAASQFVAITRAASRGPQHSAVNRIGLLHRFEALRRLSWPERELVRQLGEKLYGTRNEERTNG